MAREENEKDKKPVKKNTKKPAVANPSPALQKDLEDEIEGIDALIERYLPDDKIFLTIQEALEANRCISAIILPGKGAKTKDASGRDIDFVEVPDWTNRLKASEIACRLKNKFPKEKAEIKHVGTFSIKWEGEE